MNRILVIGATGQLGRPLAYALAREGFSVRVMARDAARLASAFGEGFELAAGDASDPRSLELAVAGCDGVHVSVAHGADEAPVVEAVARAARSEGVRRVCYVSGTTVSEKNAWFPMVAGKLKAERILQESGVPWTILRPTWFMEAIENFFQHGKAVCFGRGEVRFRLLAARDLAAAVPRAFRRAEAENRAFRLLGPESMSVFDAIERLRRARHPEISKVVRLPFWAAKGIAALRGRAGVRMSGAIELMRYFERVEEGEAGPDVAQILGPCPTTFDEWLAERRLAPSRSRA